MEGVKLHTNREADSVEIGNYQRFIGSLIYLTHTWLDIAYPVSCLSRFMSSHQWAHLDAATSILRYIRGTSNFGVFSRTTSIDLQGFVDSDWGRDLDKRRSTSSLLHKVGEVPLHWSNKLQPIVVLSTTETEYNALSDGAIEIMSLRTMMIELGEGPMQPTKVFCDNQSSIKVVKNLVLHARTKHIELQHHYIRERVEEGDIKVTNIHTSEQEADISYKIFGRSYFSTISTKNRNIQSWRILRVCLPLVKLFIDTTNIWTMTTNYISCINATALTWQRIDDIQIGKHVSIMLQIVSSICDCCSILSHPCILIVVGYHNIWVSLGITFVTILASPILALAC